MAGVVTFTGLNPAGTLSGGEIVAVTQSGSSVRTTITAIQNFITSALTTSSVAEGTNQYFTQSRVLNAILSGFSSATNSVVLATDSLLVGVGKLQAQITSLGSSKVSVSTLGVASGTATLDGTGYLTNGQIPPQLVGGMNYQGLWDASTNTPTLTSGAGTKGYIYKVSVAGTTALNGNNSWNIGDMAVYNGASWDHWDGVSAEVVSVAGRTGNVVLAYSDITGTVPTWNQNTTGTAATVTTAAQPNITSVGSSLQVGSGNTGGVFQPYSGGGYFSIYPAGITPSTTNFSLAVNQTYATLNASTQSGLGVGGVQILAATSTGVAVTGTLSTSADATIHGVTVGLGGQSVASSTVLGYAAIPLGTGINNVAVGQYAGNSLTTGFSNTIIGNQANAGGTTATKNVFVGAYAGDQTSTGSNNVMIGYQTGYATVGSITTYANITGSNNTWLGMYSGPGTTTQLSNSTAIGYGALNLNSNEMVLGNSSLTSVTTAAAITATGGFTGTLNTAAQPNITSVGTLGSLAVTGVLSSGAHTASSITNNGTTTNSASSAGIEHGSTTIAGTPYIDFHSSGNNNDYDARIIANGGTTNATGTLTVFGSSFVVTPPLTVNHIIGGSGAPTIAVGTGAGTSPTVSISGTDLAFKITLTTGTLPTASATVCTVTFNTAYGASPHPHLTPASANTALLSGVTMVWPSATTTTYVLNSGTTGLTAATTYVWECDVIQ